MAASSTSPENPTAYTGTTAPGGWPLLGHLPRLARDPLGFVSGLSRYGDVVDIRLGPSRTTVVCHPELVDRMLRDERTFDKGGPLFDRGREVAGNGLVTCPRSEHRRLRRLMQPAFQRSRFPGYAELMTEQITDELAGWTDGRILEVDRAMSRLTNRILTSCLFSSVDSEAETGTLIDSMDELMSLLMGRMLTPTALDWLPLPGKRRFDRAHQRIRAFCEQVIAERQRSQDDHGDLLSALLAAHDEDGSVLSRDELIDQLITLYGAGVDTSAAALTWILHRLATEPEVERRLHAEVDAVLAGRAATYQDVEQLTYTRQVIDEGLRRYSVIWFMTRIATVDTELGGHPIPAGRTVAYSPYLVHQRADVYPEPDRFDPDRWAGQRDCPVGGGYVPFGAGARKCIGDHFAQLETVLALATIATNWRLTALPGHSMRPRVRAVLGMASARLRLERRRHDLS